MKILLRIIVAAILALIMQQFLPWWIIAIATFAVAFFAATSALQGFSIGFLAIGLLWLGLAWWIDSSTGSILTEKIAILFNVNSVTLVLSITALIGGLVGGLGGLSGYYCQKLFKNV